MTLARKLREPTVKLGADYPITLDTFGRRWYTPAVGDVGGAESAWTSRLR